MKKIDYAKCITNSPAWDGIKNPYTLTKMYRKEELKDMYDMIEEAEEDYYNSMYC